MALGQEPNRSAEEAERRANVPPLIGAVACGGEPAPSARGKRRDERVPLAEALAVIVRLLEVVSQDLLVFGETVA